MSVGPAVRVVSCYEPSNLLQDASLISIIRVDPSIRPFAGGIALHSVPLVA